LHPAFKHGKGNSRVQTPDQVEQLKFWNNSVLAKTNYKCFLTHQETSKDDGLVCHHLYAWSSYEQLRYDVNNGIAIKRSIHKTFHQIYGFGNNTAR